MQDTNTFARRLRFIRRKRMLTQAQLGVDAGIDPMVAGGRISRYEQSIHTPDYQTAQRLAEAVNVPVAYFYCEDDDLAELLVAWAEMDQENRAWLLGRARRILAGFQ